MKYYKLVNLCCRLCGHILLKSKISSWPGFESSNHDLQVVYEAYGPASTGYVIECLTDNTNRALGAVRQAVAKSGGRVAEKGSVLFNFQRLGQILVPDPGSEDKVSFLPTSD